MSQLVFGMKQRSVAEESVLQRISTQSVRRSNSSTGARSNSVKTRGFNLANHNEFSDEDNMPTLRHRKKFLVFFCNPLTKRYSCRPIIRPGFTIAAIFVLGLLMLCLGITTEIWAEKSQSCTVEYPSFEIKETTAEQELEMKSYPHVEFGEILCDLDSNDCYRQDKITISPRDCTNVSSDNHILRAKTIIISYALTPYYQNHRRYIMSRDSNQLTGNWDTFYMDKQPLGLCTPLSTVQDLVTQYGFLTDNGDGTYSTPPGYPPLEGVSSLHEQVSIHPCGLQAWSVFNDTIVGITDYTDNKRKIITDPEVVSTQPDNDWFENPSEPIPTDSTGDSLIYNWLPTHIFPDGVRSSNFINWMRISPVPFTRKLWGVLDNDGKNNKELELPAVITVNNRYNVNNFDGHKYIIISSGNTLADTISRIYYTISSMCFVIGIIFTAKLSLRPRRVGDIRLLSD